MDDATGIPEDDDLLKKRAAAAITTEAPTGTGAPPAIQVPSTQTLPHRAGIASLFQRENNIHNPFVRGLAKVGTGILGALDTAGAVVAPRVEAAIPGSTVNQAIKLKNQRAINAEQTKEGLEKAETEKAQAGADAIRNPPEKQGVTPEETTIHDLMTGENGQPRVNPQTKQPYTYLEAYGAVKQAAQDTKADKAPLLHETDQGLFLVNPDTKEVTPLTYQGKPLMPKAAQKPDSPEQQFIDEYQRTHQGATIADALKAYGETTQKPEHEPKQLAVGPDGTVIELRPGMKVPQGTKTVTKYGEPTADEQRRADLAENLKENLNALEDIVTRRKDLFGPVAGRYTSIKEWLGSNDPDVGALGTIQHQLGMAQISAHGMRSAHGIESAAESIINSFKNGPDAVKAAINAARKSVGTFQQDVEHPQTAGTREPEANAPPRPANVPANYIFRENGPKGKGWYKP